MPWFLTKLPGCSPNCAPGAGKAPWLLGPRDPRQESKGRPTCMWVLLLLFPNVSIPWCWAAAQRCQNIHTWSLQVALSFSPASTGPTAIRHEVCVSGSPTSGHIWTQHQVPAPSSAPSPAAPAGSVCLCATPAWSEKKPPVSTWQGCAEQERENKCHLYAREMADFNNSKDKIEPGKKIPLRKDEHRGFTNTQNYNGDLRWTRDLR